MKTMKRWLEKTENLQLLVGCAFFSAAMANLFFHTKFYVNVICFFSSSLIFFYLAIHSARQSDRTLQEKKFSWGRFIFGLVVMITACICGLLFQSALGKTLEWIMNMIFVFFSTFGAIVVVYALKRVHFGSKKGEKI